MDTPLLELLRTRTDGNPLFVRELAKLVASRGFSAAAAAIPRGVTSVLMQRIERLPAGVATVLRLAALFGRSAPIDGVLTLWNRKTDESAEELVLDAIDTAVAAGLLTADVDTVHFNHVLVRDAVTASPRCESVDRTGRSWCISNRPGASTRTSWRTTRRSAPSRTRSSARSSW